MADTSLSRASASASAWLRRLTSPWAAAIVLALFYVVLLASLREKSAGFDEPGHATAGYVYWKFGDYRIDPENGNLTKRWIALPFLIRGDRFPSADTPGWRSANSWLLADAWFNRSQNNTTGMLAAGRAASGLVAVALAALVWFWSRRIFGPLGGMLSLLLCVASPTILANGALMTSDTPAALGFLAAVGSIWATLQRITAIRVAVGTIAIAGLFLAKMSAVLLLPMALILAVARIIDGRPLPVGATRVLTRRVHQAGALAVVAVLQTLGVVVLVWAAYGFRYSAFAPGAPEPHRFHKPWEWALGLPPPKSVLDSLNLEPAQRPAIDPITRNWAHSATDWSYPILDDLRGIRERTLTPAQAARLNEALAQPPSRFAPRLIHFARQHTLLPEAFLFGAAHVWRTSDRLTAFFNGEIRDTGWRSFFPFVFAVKTPLPFLALLVLALISLPLIRSRDALGRPIWSVIYPVLPLLVILLVYWTAAIAANLNIGHRHLLPIYPPLFILTGAAALPFATAASADARGSRTRSFFRFAVAGLLVIAITETAVRFPNYLAYFNGLIAPSRAHRHLIDSSLDWGQELPAIARYLRERPGEKAHLAYFGVGSPAYYGVRAKFIGGFPAIDWKQYPPFVPLLDTNADTIRAFLREHPEFDPDLIFNLDFGRGLSALLLHRPETHRLDAGLYLVSATMLQPVFHGNVDAFWNASHERAYEHRRTVLAPFITGDRAARMAVTPTRPFQDWVTLFEDYYDLRLSRLTAFLRRRQPDDIINYSVLVYRLTADDVARALEGPSP